MKKMMYLVTDRPYGKDKPVAYCYDNGHYVYQVYRDDNTYYNELLFDRAFTALEMLLRIKPETRTLH